MLTSTISRSMRRSPTSWRFFEELDRFVQIEPWLERDKVMIIDMLSIGIEKAGVPFGCATKAILDQAASEAHAYITWLSGLLYLLLLQWDALGGPGLAGCGEGNGIGFRGSR